MLACFALPESVGIGLAAALRGLLAPEAGDDDASRPALQAGAGRARLVSSLGMEDWRVQLGRGLRMSSSQLRRNPVALFVLLRVSSLWLELRTHATSLLS